MLDVHQNLPIAIVSLVRAAAACFGASYALTGLERRVQE